MSELVKLLTERVESMKAELANTQRQVLRIRRKAKELEDNIGIYEAALSAEIKKLGTTISVTAENKVIELQNKSVSMSPSILTYHLRTGLEGADRAKSGIIFEIVALAGDRGISSAEIIEVLNGKNISVEKDYVHSTLSKARERGKLLHENGKWFQIKEEDSSQVSAK